MILASFMFSCAIGGGLFFVSAVPLSAADSAIALDRGPATGTRQEVWQAVLADLRARGFVPEQLPGMEQLDLPARLAGVSGRKLRVASACREPVAQRTQFRLECGAPGQCLPFLVYLHDYVPDVHRPEIHGPEIHGPDRERGQRDAYARFGSCQQKLDPPAAAQAPPKALSNSMVKAGDRAMAEFISARVRITSSVTCLDRGRQGEVIRVRNQDGEVFRARISSSELLEVLPQ
jgi:hypothetical protein